MLKMKLLQMKCQKPNRVIMTKIVLNLLSRKARHVPANNNFDKAVYFGEIFFTKKIY